MGVSSENLITTLVAMLKPRLKHLMRGDRGGGGAGVPGEEVEVDRF